MKYKGLYINLFSALLRKPMRAMYGKKAADQYLREAKPIYRKMLEETEDIGADNPMAMNIYMGYVFLAIWKAAQGNITPAALGVLAKRFMNRKAVQMVLSGRDINRQEDLAKTERNLHRMKAWADAHPAYRDKTWDFNFDKTKHRDGIYYHFTHCPLEKYAREHGCLEALPAACSMDHMTAAAMHGVLHRQYTLATGGKICDYWIVPDGIRDPQ